jgi:hypothetical protein
MLAAMKPYMFVMASSCLGHATKSAKRPANDSARHYVSSSTIYPVLAASCADSNVPVAMMPSHMFDYSPEELSAILEWARLERRRAL